MARLRMMRAPQKYVQGKDSLLHFHEEMKDLGDKWLFICSNSGHKMCHDKIEKSFEGTKDIRRYEIFGGTSSVGEIEKMRKIVRENGLNVVVGVGGGSAIDTAKATAHYEKLPVVIVPTVVATDAPCTGLSVIYNDDKTFNSYL
ncbi:MAG: iron-containing alcohol dehydrogenase, partial [Lachnospiraceae bacterium]